MDEEQRVRKVFQGTLFGHRVKGHSGTTWRATVKENITSSGSLFVEIGCSGAGNHLRTGRKRNNIDIYLFITKLRHIYHSQRQIYFLLLVLKILMLSTLTMKLNSCITLMT